MEKIVIMGGGVAGLSCLNALLDQCESPLLLEGGTIGSPKMCGEFLAPPAVSLLQQWDIGPLQSIHQAQFFSAQSQMATVFPVVAGAIARSDAEKALAARAIRLGGRVREQALVTAITPATDDSPYLFQLASGGVIEAETAIFATGRNHFSPPPMPYYGLKLHVNHVLTPDTLLMYSVNQAYFGLVPVTDAVSNFACLMQGHAVDQAGSCKAFFTRLMDEHVVLQAAFDQVDLNELDWFESRAPEFAMKTVPAWPNAYWIGDALASLPPAIGAGFYHSISSALLAANYCLQNNPAQYLVEARQQVKVALQLGRWLHRVLLDPRWSRLAFPVLHYTPWLMQQCLKRLGYQEG